MKDKSLGWTFKDCVLEEFDGIPEKQKKKLTVIMARIMEKAYRRGVQQALHLNETNEISDKLLSSEGLHNWRYGNSIDESIGVDGFQTKSVERLLIEEPNLRMLGFTN